MPFKKRNNTQCQQGKTVLVASFLLVVACPVWLLRELHIYAGGSEDLHVSVGVIDVWRGLIAFARMRHGVSGQPKTNIYGFKAFGSTEL